jgi:hypothetical protein
MGSTYNSIEGDSPVWEDKRHLRLEWGPYFWPHSKSPGAERQSCKHQPFRSIGHTAHTLVLHNHCMTDKVSVAELTTMLLTNFIVNTVLPINQYFQIN